jgi:hypothetical protein
MRLATVLTDDKIGILEAFHTEVLTVKTLANLNSDSFLAVGTNR